MASAQTSGRFRGGAAAALLAAAALAAWSNSFSVPFLLDDGPAIVENASIRRLDRLGAVLRPELDGGVTTAGRPLVNLSLAVNWAISGERTWSYHVFNLGVHVGAGLLLFGLVRRTLARVVGAPGGGGRPGSAGGESASGRHVPPAGDEFASALAVAALWMLHPLQTAAVTYVVQRAEAMAALFALGTLYAFARAVDGESAASPAFRPARDLESAERASGLLHWRWASVAACLAGMATKETAAVVPLLVLVYDRTFVAGSFAAAWRARRGYYAALAATWLLLGVLVAGTAGRGGTAGFGTVVTPAEYFLTQCGAIVHYLRLAVWPAGLVFDHGTATVATVGEVWWQLWALFALAGATVMALVRRSRLGFIGAWFFLLLAPSSSFVPVSSQTVAEHRMYLALAAPMALAVLGLRAVLGWRAGIAVAILAATAGGATYVRNADYATALRLWTDTVAKVPGNARAHHNLGLAELARGDLAAAERHLRDALALVPKSASSHYNLALVLTRLGRPAEAIAHYQESLAAEPAQAAAHNNLGNLLLAAGRSEEAGRHYAEAVRVQPDFAGARNSFGNWLIAAGRPAEALRELTEALRLEPGGAEMHFNAGNACAALGRFEEAAGFFREAARLQPDHAEARNNLGNVLLELDRLPEAVAEFESALRLRPDYFEPRRTLALLLLLHLNRPAEARVHLEILARARPGDREIADALARARR